MGATVSTDCDSTEEMNGQGQNVSAICVAYKAALAAGLCEAVSSMSSSQVVDCAENFQLGNVTVTPVNGTARRRLEERTDGAEGAELREQLLGTGGGSARGWDDSDGSSFLRGSARRERGSDDDDEESAAPLRSLSSGIDVTLDIEYVVVFEPPPVDDSTSADMISGEARSSSLENAAISLSAAINGNLAAFAAAIKTQITAAIAASPVMQDFVALFVVKDVTPALVKTVIVSADGFVAPAVIHYPSTTTTTTSTTSTTAPYLPVLSNVSNETFVYLHGKMVTLFGGDADVAGINITDLGRLLCPRGSANETNGSNVSGFFALVADEDEDEDGLTPGMLVGLRFGENGTNSTEDVRQHALRVDCDAQAFEICRQSPNCHAIIQNTKFFPGLAWLKTEHHYDVHVRDIGDRLTEGTQLYAELHPAIEWWRTSVKSWGEGGVGGATARVLQTVRLLFDEEDDEELRGREEVHRFGDEKLPFASSFPKLQEALREEGMSSSEDARRRLAAFPPYDPKTDDPAFSDAAWIQYFEREKMGLAHQALSATDLRGKEQEIKVLFEQRYNHTARDVVNRGVPLEAGLPFRLEVSGLTTGFVKLQKFSCNFVSGVSSQKSEDIPVPEPPLQLHQTHDSSYYHNITSDIGEGIPGIGGGPSSISLTVYQGGFYRICWTVTPSDTLSWVDYGELYFFGPAVDLYEARWQTRTSGPGWQYPNATHDFVQVYPDDSVLEKCQLGEICRLNFTGDFYGSVDSIAERQNQIIVLDVPGSDGNFALLGRDSFYSVKIEDPADLQVITENSAEFLAAEYQASGGQNSLGKALCGKKHGDIYVTKSETYLEQGYNITTKIPGQFFGAEAASWSILRTGSLASERRLAQLSFLPDTPGRYAVCWNAQVFVGQVTILAPAEKNATFSCAAGEVCAFTGVPLEDEDRIRLIPESDKCEVLSPTVFRASYTGGPANEYERRLRNLLVRTGQTLEKPNQRIVDEGLLVDDRDFLMSVHQLTNLPVGNRTAFDHEKRVFQNKFSPEGGRRGRRVRLFPKRWNGTYPAFRFGIVADFGLVTDRKVKKELRSASHGHSFLMRTKNFVHPAIDKCVSEVTQFGLASNYAADPQYDYNALLDYVSQPNATRLCSTITATATPGLIGTPGLTDISDPLLGRPANYDLDRRGVFGSLSAWGPPPKPFNKPYDHWEEFIPKTATLNKDRLWYEVDFGETINVLSLVVMQPGSHVTDPTVKSLYGALHEFTIEIDGEQIVEPAINPRENLVVRQGQTLMLGGAAVGRYKVGGCSVMVVVKICELENEIVPAFWGFSCPMEVLGSSCGEGLVAGCDALASLSIRLEFFRRRAPRPDRPETTTVSRAPCACRRRRWRCPLCRPWLYHRPSPEQQQVELLLPPCLRRGPRRHRCRGAARSGGRLPRFDKRRLENGLDVKQLRLSEVKLSAARDTTPAWRGSL